VLIFVEITAGCLLLLALLSLLDWVRPRVWAPVLVLLWLLMATAWLSPKLDTVLGVAAIGIPYVIVLLSLLNWVRTRRLALVLLLFLVLGLALAVAVPPGGHSIPGYAAVITTVGLTMLLIRLWPRWRLLRPPTPEELPPQIPVARGVLSARSWPRAGDRGVTLVTVVIAFAMVLVVAAAGASCLAGAARATRAAERSLIATALLQGELERVRARDVSAAYLQNDLAARARRLLPNPRARASVKRTKDAGTRRVDLEVAWHEPGRPEHHAALSGIVYWGE
jgi:hypothetical protein